MQKNHLVKNMQIVEYFRIIGDNIRRLRVESGMSQKELAKKAEVGNSAIQATEAGKEITLTNLIKIAKALGVEPPDLFISDKDREEISYKHKLFMEKISGLLEEVGKTKK